MIHDSAFLALMGLQSLADHPLASGHDGVSPELRQIMKRAALAERRERQEAIDRADNVVVLPGRRPGECVSEGQAGTVPLSKS